MNSRERVIAAINHKEPDRVPIDLGGTGVTGISVRAMYELRKYLGLEDRLLKVLDPYTMLGIVDNDLRQVMNVDVVSLPMYRTKYGHKNKNWKKWTMPIGVDVLVDENFETSEDDSNLYIYPKGDKTAAPSGVMPKDGYYFDSIVRKEEFDEETANGRKDFEETYTLYDEEYLRDLENYADDYYKNTEYSVFGSIQGAGLGNLAEIPGEALKRTPGIRSADDWFMALLINKNYVQQVFEYQTEIALKNLEMYKQAVGDKINVILVGDTDFGTQNGEMISPNIFRELYKPYFKKMNDWVHKNTNWKTFYHSCGSILNLLDDFVEMGVDIINPVQISATGMDPMFLKEKYGKKLTFWGGGIDTQNILPFSSPEKVKEEVKEKVKIFSKNGGFIFSTVHGIQANTPPENIMAMLEALSEV